MHVSGRGQQVGALDPLVVVRMLGHHDPEYGRSLRVTHVLQPLLSRPGQNVVDHVRNVNTADFVPRKVPEHLRLVVPRAVPIGVTIPAGVTHPNVEPGIGQHVHQAGLRSHQDVIRRGTQHSMLQQDYGFTGSRRRHWTAWTAMNSQQVAVVRFNDVLLGGVTVFAKQS